MRTHSRKCPVALPPCLLSRPCMHARLILPLLHTRRIAGAAQAQLVTQNGTVAQTASSNEYMCYR